MCKIRLLVAFGVGVFSDFSFFSSVQRALKPSHFFSVPPDLVFPATWVAALELSSSIPVCSWFHFCYFLQSREQREQLQALLFFLGLSEYSGRWCLFVDFVSFLQCCLQFSICLLNRRSWFWFGTKRAWSISVLLDWFAALPIPRLGSRSVQLASL
jgi:hypothetical protein